MIYPLEFLKYLHSKGFSLATGVPCSYFKQLFSSFHRYKKIQYVPATREDEAMGIATGYFLGGGQSFLVMQNSGLATVGDALTSLAQLYKIPLLLLVSYRGLEEDIDFPEHSLMGTVTERVLKAYNLPYWILTPDHWKTTIDEALKKMTSSNLPVCLLVKKGVFTRGC